MAPHRALACSAVAALALACGADAEPPPAAPGAGGAEREADEVTETEGAREALPPASWPEDVEDLAVSIGRFESVETCVAALRARTPTAIAEAISDLEYDGFFEDVCASQAAVHDRAPERCDAIAVSSLRRGCRRRLAIVAADPTLCPPDPGIDGRDPLCVAWAARDPGLCRAAAAPDRDGCEAVLAAEAARCARDRDRPRCEAWVRRYASALAGERRRSEGTEHDPMLHLELVRELPGAAGGAPSIGAPLELELDVLARGVRLRAVGCSHVVALDERGERTSAAIGRPSARIELALPPGQAPRELPIGPGLASIEIWHPDLGRARGGEGAIVVTRAGSSFGASLEGTLRATLPLTPGALRVEGRFRTFARDVDPLPAGCAPPDPAP